MLTREEAVQAVRQDASLSAMERGQLLGWTTHCTAGIPELCAEDEVEVTISYLRETRRLHHMCTGSLAPSAKPEAAAQPLVVKMPPTSGQERGAPAPAVPAPCVPPPTPPAPPPPSSAETPATAAPLLEAQSLVPLQPPSSMLPPPSQAPASAAPTPWVEAPWERTLRLMTASAPQAPAAPCPLPPLYKGYIILHRLVTSNMDDLQRLYRDPNAPKRPHTASTYFGLEHRAQLREQRQGQVKVCTIEAELAQVWAATSKQDRVPFMVLAAEAKARYEKDVGTYIATFYRGEGSGEVGGAGR